MRSTTRSTNCRACCSTAPENLAALRGLGETHQRRGHLPAALGVYRRALALAPHDAELAALVSAIEPSVPGNGDSRRWPPPSGSHPNRDAVAAAADGSAFGRESHVSTPDATRPPSPVRSDCPSTKSRCGSPRTAACAPPRSICSALLYRTPNGTTRPSRPRRPNRRVICAPSKLRLPHCSRNVISTSCWPRCPWPTIKGITPDAREMLASWSVALNRDNARASRGAAGQLVAKSGREPPASAEAPPLPLMLRRSWRPASRNRCRRRTGPHAGTDRGGGPCGDDVRRRHRRRN